MTTITGITSQPKQHFAFALEDGSQVSAYIEYRPQQLGWFANFSWGDNWVVNGLRLVSTPNLLHHWSASGMSAKTALTGRSTVVFLNAVDVLEVNEAAFSSE